LYTPEERAGIQGYLSSVWGISAVIGPLAGGVIVERLSWPWVFWINLPIGVATIAGLMVYLHEGVEHHAHKVDYLGSVFFAVGISALLGALTQASQPSNTGSLALAFAAIAAFSLGLFVWQERRAREPMLSLELWTHRVIASANGATLAAGMTLIGVTTFLAVYVQAVMGYSATVAGFALTMMAVGWPVASTLSRRFYNWIGMRSTLRVGSVFLILGGLVFYLLEPTSSPALAGLGSMLMGFGMGLLNTAVILLVQGSVEWRQRGSATASNLFSRNLGSTLGAAVLGTALNLALKDAGVAPEAIRRLLDDAPKGDLSHLRAALDQGLHLTFGLVVLLSVGTLALALFIPDRTLDELSK
ncbi:MAG TPA: MFS transporter, partial [Fimbriimonas sp.]